MALLLDQAARRYGTRPSTLLKVKDDALALELDVALAERAKQDAWNEIRGIEGDNAWFTSILLLVMDLVKG